LSGSGFVSVNISNSPREPQWSMDQPEFFGVFDINPAQSERTTIFSEFVSDSGAAVTSVRYNQTKRVDTTTNTEPAFVDMPLAARRPGEICEVKDTGGAAGTDNITVRAYTATASESFTYIADDGDGDSAITRPAGDFTADGFTNLLPVVVSSTVSNNGTFTVKKVEAGKLTLSETVLTDEAAVASDNDQAETIDGAATYVMAADNRCVKLRSDGASNWLIVGLV